MAKMYVECPKCGNKIEINKKMVKVVCYACNEIVDVKKSLNVSQNLDNKLAIIKYEGNNETLVWKHPVEDFLYGSQLIVHESQEAIFFKEGKALDLFGSGKHILETDKLPLFHKFYKTVTNKVEPFHSEVYFINISTHMGIRWGTDSKIRLLDPFSGMHIELGASGTFNLRVVDSRKLLLKLVGTTTELTDKDIINPSMAGPDNKFKSLVVSKVKTYLAKIIRENDINILEIDEHIEELSHLLRSKINNTLNDYGLEISEFYILNIVTPDDDPNFIRLKRQYAERYLNVQEERILKQTADVRKERKRIEAETEAEAVIIKAKAEAEAYRLKAEAEADEMKLKGYTYEAETRRKVGVEAVKGENVDGVVSGAVKDAINIGVGLGVMKEVVDTVKDTLSIANGDWECPTCHVKGLKSNFCPNCGEKRVK